MIDLIARHMELYVQFQLKIFHRGFDADRKRAVILTLYSGKRPQAQQVRHESCHVCLRLSSWRFPLTQIASEASSPCCIRANIFQADIALSCPGASLCLITCSRSFPPVGLTQIGKWSPSSCCIRVNVFLQANLQLGFIPYLATCS